MPDPIPKDDTQNGAGPSPTGPVDSDATVDLDAPSQPSSQQEFGQWGGLVLRKKIGQGAFGEVYRAWDPSLDREVALKLLRSKRASDGRLIKSEARLIAKVRHENVAAVYGVAEHDGRVGLWMEFIDGRTLDQLVRGQGRLGPREATAIGIDVCRALTAVHSLGLLHCDIKAQNVMRAEGGRIVLMDFGLSQAFGGGRDINRIGGTPSYMAPELFERKPPTVQSDIYSLGVLLYFLVTGSFPVDGVTWEEFRNPERHRRLNLLRDVRPDLPESYLQIVERALQEAPGKRFETAGQMLQSLAGNWSQASSPFDSVEVAVPRRRLLRNAAIGGAALAAGGLAFWRLRPDAFRAHSSFVRAIAVLPFENLTRDPDTEYFSDGITEELINALTRVPGLRVVARTSVFRFKGQHPDPQAVGKQLGVDSILNGSIRKSEDRIRAVVDLVSTRDGYQMWADVYERPLKDTFEVQESIAESVVSKLQLQFAPSYKASKGEFTEADAYYLRGLFHAAKSSPLEVRQAIDYYKKAIAGKPDHARAWAGLAEAWALLGFYDPRQRAEASANAKPAIAKALALDPTLAEAYDARAFIQFEYDWDWPAAEASALQATRQNPSYAHAWLRYSTILATLGRFEETLSTARRSLELDPLSVPASNQVGIGYYLLQQYDQASKQLSRSLDLDSRSFIAHNMSGWVNMGLKQPAKAIEDFRTAVENSGNSPFAVTSLVCAYALSGDARTARQFRADMEATYTPRFFGPVLRASIESALGERDQAFADLALGYDQRDPQMIQIRINPGLAPIRSDPRFAVLLRKMKLDRS